MGKSVKEGAAAERRFAVPACPCCQSQALEGPSQQSPECLPPGTRAQQLPQPNWLKGISSRKVSVMFKKSKSSLIYCLNWKWKRVDINPRSPLWSLCAMALKHPGWNDSRMTLCCCFEIVILLFGGLEDGVQGKEQYNKCSDYRDVPLEPREMF